MKVLVLGGTAEARALAAALAEVAGCDAVSSLAGRVRAPAMPVGRVRIGGFGGTAGLRAYLAAERVDAVVDATHPFAATITAHAGAACAALGVPRVVVRRPGWAQSPLAGGWHWVGRIDEAPGAVGALSPAGCCVFLTTGRRDLAVFAGDEQRRYLVRTVDPPEGPTPRRLHLILDRGPYRVEQERELMREHRVRLLVTKDSGGSMTSAKLTAAHELGLAVLVVARPPLPAGTRAVPDVPAALRWLAELAGPGAPAPNWAGIRRSADG